MSFLKAEWRKLILANYEVDPAILQPYLPYGTELDLWQGRNYVSLVGFMFKNVRMLGSKDNVSTENRLNFTGSISSKNEKKEITILR